MGKNKTFDVKVTVAPVSGKPVTKTVTVVASATLAEVAAEAGFKDLSKLNLSVDGQPAMADTRVTSRSRVAISQLTITERPQGS